MVGRVFVAISAVVGASWLSGCSSGCGEFEHQTGIEWDLDNTDDDPAEPIDEYTLHEICGAKMGSIGYRDPGGDGITQLRLDGSHADAHVAITLTSAIFQELYFQTAGLEVGRTLTVGDLTNQGGVFESAAYVIVDGVAVSGASLTEGEVEFLEVKPNAFWATDAYRVRFDVTFGEPGTSEFWYTAVGEDWIAML